MLFKTKNALLPCVRLISGALLTCLVQLAAAQNAQPFSTIELNSLSAFKNAGPNWVVSSDALADYTIKEDLRPVNGIGVLSNVPDKKNKSHLITQQEWGDLELELDFMMARNSNAGVYLQGRYEIQLFDSWTKLNPTPTDCGSIYFRWLDGKGNYEGSAPAMNVSRAPGLWQHLQIRFRAPRFDAAGKKIANARFEEVYLNGVLVQDAVEITGPTRSSLFDDEQPRGPLMIQGDHGPVAVKNIHYREMTTADTKPARGLPYDKETDPIWVSPGAEPYLLRSFVMHNDKKLTHVISIGYPEKLNYSYDIKHGALFQVWRGDYLDVTQMWTQRGQPQTAYPRGSVVSLSGAPAVAVLAQPNEAWPDAVAFYDLKEEGYTLTGARTPVFKYSIKGISVTDSIAPLDKAEGLVRKIDITTAVANLYIRIAAASTIEKISDELYAVDGKSYYIKLAASFNTVVRSSGASKELLVKYAGNPVQYSIIW